MKEYKCVIVDDEPGNITALAAIINEYCPTVKIAGTASDSVEAFDVITQCKPDIVFLDIEMPFGNAFTLLDKLSPVCFEVVFVSAFDSYAITAIKYAALDYVLKPVSIEELKIAVKKAIVRLEEKKMNTRIDSLLNNIKANHSPLRIGLPTTDGVLFENVNNIMYLQAVGSYTYVIFTEKKKQMISMHLGEFREILPESIFFRIHNSYIVNVNHVSKYYHGRGGYVIMTDGTSIEVSTRRRNEFLEKFKR